MAEVKRFRQRNGSNGSVPFVLGAIAIAIVAGAIGAGIGVWVTRATAPAASDSTGAPIASGSGSCNAVRVADSVLPAIVTVQVKGESGSGVGSGEIIRDNGYIVTNNHVISAAAASGTISVVYSSGKSATASLVGRDPSSDLAVLKVSSTAKLPTVTVGDSARLQVGEPVVALGAPLGLSSSVTAGIVSALGRDVAVPSDNGTTATLAGAIQTDAAINPGNSGGALVNCAGALVGINTAIATVPNSTGDAGGGSVGIGFAVPSTSALRTADRLISGGTAPTPYLGISVAPIPEAVAERFGITDGLYLVSVAPGGPAEAAGLQVGDVIIEIDGHPATNADVLSQVTSSHKVGDRVEIHYLREGQPATTTVTLAALK